MRRAMQDATACREALLRLPTLGLGELRQQWRVLYKAEAAPCLSWPLRENNAENETGGGGMKMFLTHG